MGRAEDKSHQAVHGSHVVSHVHGHDGSGLNINHRSLEPESFSRVEDDLQLDDFGEFHFEHWLAGQLQTDNMAFL